jgi:hypothetical protein
VKIGRPTKYRPEYCDLAEAILAADKPWCEVARILQVCENTLDRWKAKYPEFCSAYMRGKAAGKALFMAKVKQAAWGENILPVNNGMISLLAVNMYGLISKKAEEKRDVTTTNLSVADAVRLRHEAMASG